MALFKPAFNILPEGTRAGGLLPWIISVMIYLCALAIFSAVALQWGIATWSANLERSFTVQVPAETAAAQGFTASVTAALTAVRGVEQVDVLSLEDNTKLLETWLGDGNVTEDLPVPALIDVTIAVDTTVERAALLAALEPFKGAQVDSTGTWLTELKKAAIALIANAYFVLAIVIAATIAVVIFGTRAQLAAHRPTIKIVHHMGADDQVIAREFQFSFLRLGFIGGVMGVVVAVITLVLMSFSIGDGSEGLLSIVSGNWAAGLLLVPLPLFSALVTMLTARATVMVALRAIP